MFPSNSGGIHPNRGQHLTTLMMSNKERAYKAKPLEPSKSTSSGYQSAVKLYNEKFAPANDFKQFNEITLDYLLSKDEESNLCVFDLFRRFGTFLTQKVADRTESGFYSPNSAYQIFSNFKMAVDKKVKGLCPYLREPNCTWYEQLGHQLRRKCVKQAASRGDSVSDSSDAIWRGILIEICRYFVKSSYQNGYLWRVVFVTLYLVIGRAGEAATATWDSMCWNTTLKCPEMNWVEIKTGKVLPVPFFCDKKDWEVCWWHCLFCYLMSDGAGTYDFAGGQMPDGKDFLFPYILSGDVASSVTKVLHDLAELGVIPGLTKRHTSHGLKAGASDDAALNRFCSIIAIVSRANWDYSGQVRMTNPYPII